MFDVITIGTASRDVFLQSEFFKVLRDIEHLKRIGFPEGEAQCFALGGKVEVSKPVLTTGGGATNAAVTFSRQGLKTASLIKVGADEAGDKILRELKGEGVGVFGIKDKHTGTAYSTILLAQNGERTILVYRGASENLEKREIPLGRLRADWVYIAPSNIPVHVINGLVDHLHKSGVNIAINPSSKIYLEKKMDGLRNILNKSKVVLFNREEAAYLTGINYEHEKKIFRQLDMAVPGIAVMTDGGRGVHVSDGLLIYSAGVFKERLLVDRTGAGDAFGSGFVAGLIQKKEKCEKGLCSPSNIEYAIRLGSANATSVIEKIGAKAGILTQKEFDTKDRWSRLSIKVATLK